AARSSHGEAAERATVAPLDGGAEEVPTGRPGARKVARQKSGAAGTRPALRVPRPRPHATESLVDSKAAGGRGTRPRWRVMTVLVLVALAGALVAAGLGARSWEDRRQLDGARQQALAAARQTTVNFVSISATTVDADLSRISDGATGQFKDEFTGDMAQI